MPEEMKRAMVNIEGLRHDEIREEVRRLLDDAPDELTDRTAMYTACVERHYMAIPNMYRVMQEITSHRRV
jgi:hypothetical protein